MQVNQNIVEDEILIRCRQANSHIERVYNQIVDITQSLQTLEVSLNGNLYYINCDEILFFETTSNFIAVHTVNQIFSLSIRLYELDELLSDSFMRISKSCIVNIKQVRMINKNITGASEIGFEGSNKKAYASRNYIKLLLSRMEEQRIQYYKN